ncbi:hypothetical protein L1049_026803 [Liquidambar formosana]|uniref:Uncharacterized protein n=1 Tax=Liquidambar formosana TaxID=63359 RepID=A0AAP0R8D3_LIQFO
MNRSTKFTPVFTLDNIFDDGEKEVGEILVSLEEYVFAFLDLTKRLPFYWGCKRKRSALNDTPRPSPLLSPIHTVPFLPSPLRNGEWPNIKVEASTTVTPRSFSPAGDFNVEPMQPKRKFSKKRTKAELFKILAELTQSRDVLQGLSLNKAVPDLGVDWKLGLKVMKSEEPGASLGGQDHHHYHPSIAHQSSLVSSGQTTQGHHIFGKSQNPFSQRASISHQQPLVIDQTAHGSKTLEDFQHPYSPTAPLAGPSTGMGMKEHLRPLAVPNLDILLQLSDPFTESESLRRFPSSWGVKRKRSAASGVTPSPSRVRSTPSPPSILRTRVGEDETLPIRKAEATSPATPLSFSPSESDAKSKHSLSKILKKRKKEEWLEMIAELTQRRELLKGDMETCEARLPQAKSFEFGVENQETRTKSLPQ